MADPTEIERALAVLFEPGEVVEIRAFRGRRCTISGYYDDLGRLARDAIKLNRASGGVYVTLNRVHPDLLARRANRYEEYASTTTSDDQILRRRWLPIDLDPVRPAGISASHEEHEAAIAVARKTQQFLMETLGWPEPVMADSGNGAHVLFAIDLPNDQASMRLVQAGLRALDMRFSDSKVAVDTGNFNAGRIWKLYGTVAGKGDHTAARPHRLARLLCVPEVLEAVGAERLAALAALAPRREDNTKSPAADPGVRFDLAEWIAVHRLDVTGPDPWQDGQKWVFAVCPWNPEHADRSAFIVEKADGTIAAGCHHNGCQGKGWHDLRDVLEPGWRERRSGRAPRVTARGTGPVRGSMATSPEPQPWPEPEPLGPPVLPSFPVEVLPEPLRRWAQAESIATQTPVDLPAMLGLAVSAACVAKRVEIDVRDGWIEPPNLYVVVVLEPANRKSGVFSDATAPLREFERGEVERLAPAILEYRARVKVLEGRQKRLEERAAKTDDEEPRQGLTREAVAVAHELAQMLPVVAPRLIVDDCTSERLASLLVEQGGRIASMSAEGGVFDLMKGAYSKHGIPMFNVYLQGHAGDDIRVDRVSRPAEYVHRPAITMGLAVQPEVIRGLFDQPAFRGRGLLARFLYAIPQSTLGHREVSPPPVPHDVAEVYGGLIKTLCWLDPDTDAEGRPTPHRLTLSPAALDRLHGFMREIEPELGLGGRLAGLKDWAGKLAGAVVRLAGVMHMIAHARALSPWSIPVSAETLQAAVRVGRYLVGHAEAAFQMMREDRWRSDAEHVLGWILRYRRTEFTKRDLHQATKNRFARAEDLDAPLAELVKRFLIRHKPTATEPRPGRPASPVFEVNPAVFAERQNESGSSKNHPQYPQNSVQTATASPTSGNCGDIGDGFGELGVDASEDEVNALLAATGEEDEASCLMG